MIRADRLLDLLAERKMSQADLGRRVGISATAVNHIIKRGSGSSHVVQIARELGTSPEYLLGETDDPQISWQDEDLTADDMSCLVLWRQLEETDREVLRTLMRSLLR